MEIKDFSNWGSVISALIGIAMASIAWVIFIQVKSETMHNEVDMLNGRMHKLEDHTNSELEKAAKQMDRDVSQLRESLTARLEASCAQAIAPHKSKLEIISHLQKSHETMLNNLISQRHVTKEELAEAIGDVKGEFARTITTNRINNQQLIDAFNNSIADIRKRLRVLEDLKNLFDRMRKGSFIKNGQIKTCQVEP